MTPPWVLRVFRTARYHWLDRQVLFNEKDGLLLIPNISFYDAQSFLKNIFSVSSPCHGQRQFSLPGNLSDYNNILSAMKKDTVQP